METIKAIVTKVNTLPAKEQGGKQRKQVVFEVDGQEGAFCMPTSNFKELFGGKSKVPGIIVEIGLCTYCHTPGWKPMSCPQSITANGICYKKKVECPL